MNRIAAVAAAAALLATTTASPALAAEDIREPSSPQQRTAAFAGGTVRIALSGERKARKPEARLQLGFTHSYADLRSAAPTRTLRVATFELGASDKGKPALYMGGHDVRGLDNRLGLSTGGVVAIGAGVLLGVLALVLAGRSQMDDGSLCWDGEDCD